MDDDVKKTIQEKFDALPKSIQEIILSTNYEETVIEIGKQYQLNVEQMGILERETTVVMMGLVPTTDFETELTRELKIDKVKGSQIAQTVNEKIFSKIRELLKLMNTPAGEKPSFEESKEALKNEEKVLSTAGIEIIPEKLELTMGEKQVEKREDILKGIEKREEIHPILTQKLSSPSQTPVTKTDHSLSNITSGSVPASRPKIDPYREIPE